jgi:hypothetical protein
MASCGGVVTPARPNTSWPSVVNGAASAPIETGREGGAVKVIACIEDPEVIEKILTRLHEKTA